MQIMVFVFSAVSRDGVKTPANEDGTARREKGGGEVSSHRELN